MAAGDILFDVGANVGMYSIWAGNRGVKVYAFEPEASNYEILCRNIALNNLDVDAYCLAISDKLAVSRLHLSSREVGRSCHSFGESVGPNLQPRKSIPQGSIGISIDGLVELGLPCPNHIKVDVDGIEHIVLKGAKKTLKRPELKTLQVEFNPAMKEHGEAIAKLKEAGWYIDQKQVNKAARPAGEWKGYAEHLFYKFSEMAWYTIDKIDNAEVIQTPYPHIYIKDIFHPLLYSAMIESFPDNYQTIESARNTKGYPERFVSSMNSGIWNDVKSFLLSGAVREAFTRKFGVTGEEEALLIRDFSGYAIGPHTDSQKKIMSALFYLPKDDSMKEFGTSIYTPKQEGFTCSGVRHYPFADFDTVSTMPFMPNSLFAFPKSNKSFHGVEKFIGEGVRDILLYDIRHA